MGPVLTFGLDQEVLAIPVERVQEILEMGRVTRLPASPPHILGVIDLRGESLSLLDLRCLMRLPPVADDAATRVVVLWVEQGGRRARVAMRADRVYEVTMLDEDKVEPLPEADLLQWDGAMLAGLGRRNGAFVALLDLDRMVERLSLAA